MSCTEEEWEYLKRQELKERLRQQIERLKIPYAPSGADDLSLEELAQVVKMMEIIKTIKIREV